MNDQAFKTLEYDQLRTLMRRNAQTVMGQLKVDQITPLDSRVQLQEELRAVAECVLLRSRGVAWSFAELADVTATLALLGVEGTTLEPLDLLAIARLCEQALSARASIV